MGQANGINGQRGAGQLGAGGMNGQYGGGAYGQNGQNNRNNRQNQSANGQGSRSRSEIPIATTYTIGFDTPGVAPGTISTKLSAELNRSRSIGLGGGVNVQIEGKTAVLKGTVASDHDRDLAAKVAMLEPGVSQVKNELQVAGSAPRAAAPTVSSRSGTGSSASDSSAATSSPALAAPQN
jgi:hypothetical protein